MALPTEITVSQLARLIGTPETPVVIDIRIDEDFTVDPRLIRRFVDPGAVFLDVAASEVEAVADRFGAMPFDVDGVFWSHRGPVGSAEHTCSFDTMLAEFGLSSPALDRLAVIVRAADTARLDLAPQAAGFLAASLGLSRMFSDDLARLDAAMLLYDAMYRWCRDGTEETHNWPNPGRKA